MSFKGNQFSIAFTKFKLKHPRFTMTVLVFIVIPVLASLALGYEMKADVAVTIPTVVMDGDNTDFSRSYIDYVEESEYFNIVKYAGSYKEAEQTIRKGEAYAGVVIPENFYADMLAGKAPKILTIYDGSTMAVIVSSKSSMMDILLTVKSGYMKNVYEGKQNVVPGQVMNQVVPIDSVTRTLYNPAKSFRNFILPGMLAAVVQVAIAISGAERGFENRGKPLRFSGHIKRVAFWSLLGAMSMLLCISLQWIFFGMPLRGSVPGFLLLTAAFSAVITMLGYIIGSVFPERMFCVQLSCIFVLPTAILGGYTWPVLAMPAALQYVAKAIPFTYYSEAIRNICLKPVTVSHLMPDIIFMAVFFAVELLGLYVIKHVEGKRLVKEEATWA